MSEAYNYIRYEDEYIKIEQLGKSGWIADFKLYTKKENVKAVISSVTWTSDNTNYADGYVFDDVIVSDGVKQGGFTIGRSDNPLKEHTTYTVLSSYELYIDGIYVDLFGFSFTFQTTSRYEAGAIYQAPVIHSITESNFYSEFSVVIAINEFATYCDYYIYVTITDTGGNVAEFDNTTLFVSSVSGDMVTYIARVPKDKINYGKITVTVTTVASEKNSDSDGADIKSETANFYRYFKFNSLTGIINISADEWNDYNSALASAIAGSNHGNYTYSEVIPGEEMTLELLNEPINGYYKAFGWYFRDDVIPRTAIHIGKKPEAVAAITANQFFSGLEDMLNSFFV